MVAMVLVTVKRVVFCKIGQGPVRKNMFHLWEEGTFRSGSVLSSKLKKSVLSVQNMDILLLLAKEIILPWKVVKTANRKKLAMAKKELEDRQTKGEVTPWRMSMSVARKGIQHLHLL